MRKEERRDKEPVCALVTSVLQEEGEEGREEEGRDPGNLPASFSAGVGRGRARGLSREKRAKAPA